MATRCTALVLIVLGIPAMAGGQEVTDQERAATGEGRLGVPLVFYDQASLSREIDVAMRAEVARILEDAGVPVSDLTEEARKGSSRMLYGFRLGVTIRAQSPISWGLPDDAMGVTFGRHTPPRNVYVFYSVVRRHLGIANKRPGYLSDESVGRALGRVVVHEIVHAFAPDHKHDGWGIMGHEQDKQSLTQAGLTLDDETARVLRDAWETARRPDA